jgi:hypothetical protein
MHPDQGKHEPENSADYDDEVDKDESVDATAAPGRTSAVARHLNKTKKTMFSPEASGLLQYFAHQAKHVLSNPVEFFDQMHTEGGLTEPTIFLVISASIYGLFEAIGHLNPIVFFQTFASSLAFVYLGAIIVNFALKAFGGKGNYESTLRVLAFSKATLLFAWISVASFAIGGFLAIGYSVYLNIIGCKKVHQLATPITATVIIALALFQLLIKMFLKI